MVEGNSPAGEEEKEKIKIELEAPADELVIKRQPTDPAVSKENDKTAGTSPKTRQAIASAEEARRNAEAEKQEAKEKADSDSPEVAGYKLKELAKAPLEPPEPESQEPKRYHKIMVIIGCAVAIFGLVIIWPFVSLAAGVAVIAIGGVIVAVGTLPRV